ncbi:hypothetical protein N8I74_10710 [Chitiniphilus purpureus]|uniref:Uncharacterized protein n=1 Tax=Chitiniphilus purpureus TaxID=2981137 RepID=A0ABY6DHH5_9NEIS|nr:hypothetical protein [Chitiniphilus sp. CD1]UXY13792.1 hypothetical protein N8I74_10710 [Chitiniphilus sp. CD1]
MFKHLLLLPLAALLSAQVVADSFPEERARGRSPEYQQGFRDGWRAAQERGPDRWDDRWEDRWDDDGYRGRRPALRIESARYVSGKRKCDFTRWLSSRANGRREYLLDASNRLCGDPSPGDRKQAEVQYFCGPERQVARIDEGESTWLRCN